MRHIRGLRILLLTLLLACNLTACAFTEKREVPEERREEIKEIDMESFLEYQGMVILDFLYPFRLNSTLVMLVLRGLR